VVFLDELELELELEDSSSALPTARTRNPASERTDSAFRDRTAPPVQGVFLRNPTKRKNQGSRIRPHETKTQAVVAIVGGDPGPIRHTCEGGSEPGLTDSEDDRAQVGGRWP
jgi:hypothetical protein